MADTWRTVLHVMCLFCELSNMAAKIYRLTHTPLSGLPYILQILFTCLFRRFNWLTLNSTLRKMHDRKYTTRYFGMYQLCPHSINYGTSDGPSHPIADTRHKCKRRHLHSVTEELHKNQTCSGRA